MRGIMTRESNRIPSLDGLRCIAVSMVLLSHLLGTQEFLRPSAGTFLYEFGNLGVKVFFVYLIEQPCLGVRQHLEKIAFANGPKPATVPANPEVSLDASGVA